MSIIASRCSSDIDFEGYERIFLQPAKLFFFPFLQFDDPTLETLAVNDGCIFGQVMRKAWIICCEKFESSAS